jgi:subfamily B ATP-binding cassette protein MsbA
MWRNYLTFELLKKHKTLVFASLFWLPVYSLCEMASLTLLNGTLNLIFKATPQFPLQDIFGLIDFQGTVVRQRLVLIFPIAIALVGLFRFLASFLSSFYVEKLGYLISSQLRLRLMDTFLHCKGNALEQLNISAVGRQIVLNSLTFQSLFTKDILNLLRDFMVFVFLTLYFIVFALKIFKWQGFLIMFGLLFIFLLFYIIFKKTKKISSSTHSFISETYDRAYSIQKDFMLIKALNLEKTILARWAHFMMRKQKFLLKSIRFQSIIKPSLELFLVLILCFCLLLKFRGYDFSHFFHLLLILIFLFRPLRTMIESSLDFQHFIHCITDTEKLYTQLLLAQRKDFVLPIKSISSQKETPLIKVTDLVHNLGEDQKIECPEFTLLPQKIIGLVGKSGAGKTTFLRILAKIIEPDSGSIFCSESVTFCTQSPYLFNTTIENNILPKVLKNSNTLDKQELYSLFEELLLVKTPMSYSFMLQKEFFGDNLSQGEQIRLSFVRSLVSQSSILLLDEPTAHLDTESIDAFWRCLTKWVKSSPFHSCVVVSHRLEDMPFFDKIYEIQNSLLIPQS